MVAETTNLVTASFTFHGEKKENVPVINPGAWFGKTWLLEIGGSFWPLYLIVEADTISDAIDELAECEKYKHNIVVSKEDEKDYDPETHSHYGPNGETLDLDNLMVHGKEVFRSTTKKPFNCRYHAPGLPADGIDPMDLDIDMLEQTNVKG